MTIALAHDTITPDVETSGEDYARRFGGPVGAFFVETQARAVCDLIEWRDGQRILEVGGGHGQITPALLQHGAEVWVQGSSSACGRRTEGRPEYGTRLRFVASNLWSLPFPQRDFDVVIAVRLLSHVERWRELLAEMARVTRRQMVIDYASLVGTNILTPVMFRIKRRIEGNTRPYFCYTGRTLIRALRGLGFTRFRLRKQFCMPMGVHRAVGRRGLSESVERVCRTVGMTYLLGSPVLLSAEKEP